MKRDLVSIFDLSKEDIEQILALSLRMREQPPVDLCKGSILASCFFEPSTRTRLSFEAAMHRLGGAVIGFSEGANTSAKKGETLSDTMRVIGGYCDIAVIRHPQEGAARLAAESCAKPVINAGDGANQHPTQTLLDLFAIRECQGKIDDLSIAIAGDLKHSRTVHSLVLALTHYGVRLYFISPEPLQLPAGCAGELRKKGVKFSFHETLEEVLPKVDILYMTRVQKERFHDPSSPIPHLKKNHLAKAKTTLRILAPLPRQEELDPAIDASPHAYYFQQAQGGLYVRMAILSLFLQKTKKGEIF
ncbi:MAG: aspartate carbamoyltransferase [Verrucomicrobiota bacterium]|nr:aspartate carbamoyltransferase [Verrucomicrobiota bacterium]